MVTLWQRLLNDDDGVLSRWLPPFMRVALLVWLLPERFIGAGDHLKRAFDNRVLESLHAPHLSGPLGLLDLWPPPPSFFPVFQAVLVIATIAALVGVGTRLALLLTAACFTIYYGVISGYGFFNHTPALACQLLWAMAFVPGATNLTLEGWWRRRGEDGVVRSLLPPTPKLGAMLLLLTVGLVYGASGLAKIRYGGLDWFDGTTLQFYLKGGSRTVQTWLLVPGTNDIAAYAYLAQPSRLALAIAQVPWLCAVLAWLTVVVEAGAPLFLFVGHRARILWCVAAVGFHLAVDQMMGISFTLWMVSDVIIAAVSLAGWWQERRGINRRASSGP